MWWVVLLWGMNLDQCANTWSLISFIATIDSSFILVSSMDLSILNPLSMKACLWLRVRTSLTLTFLNSLLLTTLKKKSSRQMFDLPNSWNLIRPNSFSIKWLYSSTASQTLRFTRHEQACLIRLRFKRLPSKARWKEMYLSIRFEIKHTRSWRDKLTVLWTLNRQVKLFLRISQTLVADYELQQMRKDFCSFFILLCKASVFPLAM